MKILGTATFKGCSGKEYKFNIYDLKSKLDNVPAIYIVTRREIDLEGYVDHFALYIGQTDDLKKRFSKHDKQGCFKKNQANRLCLIFETDEQNRILAESDLLTNYKTPCNN
jgi:hypothetical protein